VIAGPPEEVGAVQDTFSSPDTPVGAAAGAVGAPGTVPGTTEADGADSALAPTVLFECTVSVYEVPAVSPVAMVHVVVVTVAVPVLQLAPLLAVAV